MRLARETLVQQLQPYIRIASREAKDICVKAINDLKQGLAGEFEDRLDERLLEITQQEEALKRGLETTREEMGRRKLLLARAAAA